MKKQLIKGIDLSLYHDQLDSGLNIYVIPMPETTNIYATFTTDYGSMHNSFIPINEDKMIVVNDGIAHFLEHKLFEQKNGLDPFSFYAQKGAHANAGTSNDKTTYLFSCPNDFEENMNYLLDFVQTPYLTDENVEKENGIIAEELKMYLDSPLHCLNDLSTFNSFNLHPMRISIGGTVESIYKITKSELLKCYDTFYNPSNMFVVVTGNVDPDLVFKVVSENQAKKDYKKNEAIKLNVVDEQDSVAKEYEEIKMDVVVPKVAVNFKLNYSHSKLDLEHVSLYLDIWFRSKFGVTSKLLETLKNKDILTNPIGLNDSITDKHILYMVDGETNQIDEFIKCIKDEAKDLLISSEELERKKKVIISSLIKASDDIYIMNEKITSELITYKKVTLNDIEIIKSLNLSDLNDLVNSISFDNISVVVVKPIKE